MTPARPTAAKGRAYAQPIALNSMAGVFIDGQEYLFISDDARRFCVQYARKMRAS